MAYSNLYWFRKLSRYNTRGIGRFFKRYRTPLVWFADSYVKDEKVAEDIVRKVFLGLAGNRQKFFTIENLKVYVYSVVKNQCLKYIRHKEAKERNEQYMLLDEGEEVLDQEKILEEEIFSLLNQAIQELPVQCKKVFLLTLAGKKDEDIAEVLRLSIETVKSHKKAGKKMLYTKLKGAVSSVVLAFYMTLLSR